MTTLGIRTFTLSVGSSTKQYRTSKFNYVERSTTSSVKSPAKETKKSLFPYCWDLTRPDTNQDALKSLSEAEQIIEAGGERWAHSEIVRLKGEIARGQACHADAEGHFQSAMDIARGQGAKPLGLRAATSLARLWRDQGKPAEAHAVLGPLYEWFSEGFDTPDLKDAKKCLDDLV